MNDDQPLEGGDAGALDGTDQEMVPEIAPDPTPSPSGDPLDDIRDEAVRAEAKRMRAVFQAQGRVSRKAPEAPAPAPAPAPSQPTEAGYVATTVAKTLVSEEVKANWNELLNIPLAGYNALDPESIAANMTARLAVYKATQKPGNPAKDLTTTQALGTPGSAPEAKKSIMRPLSFEEQAERLYGK